MSNFRKLYAFSISAQLHQTGITKVPHAAGCVLAASAAEAEGLALRYARDKHYKFSNEYTNHTVAIYEIEPGFLAEGLGWYVDNTPEVLVPATKEKNEHA